MAGLVRESASMNGLMLRKITFGSLAVIAGLGAACGHQTQPDCLSVPAAAACALPVAITVTATSASGGPVPGLTFTSSGALSGSGPCNAAGATTICTIFGGQGTYTVLLTAPGFQDKTLTVTVPGTMPACGCPTIQMQQISVVLAPK